MCMRLTYPSTVLRKKHCSRFVCRATTDSVAHCRQHVLMSQTGQRESLGTDTRNLRMGSLEA